MQQWWCRRIACRWHQTEENAFIVAFNASIVCRWHQTEKNAFIVVSQNRFMLETIIAGAQQTNYCNRNRTPDNSNSSNRTTKWSACRFEANMFTRAAWSTSKQRCIAVNNHALLQRQHNGRSPGSQFIYAIQVKKASGYLNRNAWNTFDTSHEENIFWKDSSTKHYSTFYYTIGHIQYNSLIYYAIILN